MKKVLELAFIGTAAYVSGLLYERGRKDGKDGGPIDPKAWAGVVGSRMSRKLLADLVKEAAKRAQPGQD